MVAMQMCDVVKSYLMVIATDNGTHRNLSFERSVYACVKSLHINLCSDGAKLNVLVYQALHSWYVKNVHEDKIIDHS